MPFVPGAVGAMEEAEDMHSEVSAALSTFLGVPSHLRTRGRMGSRVWDEGNTGDDLQLADGASNASMSPKNVLRRYIRSCLTFSHDHEERGNSGRTSAGRLLFGKPSGHIRQQQMRLSIPPPSR